MMTAGDTVVQYENADLHLLVNDKWSISVALLGALLAAPGISIIYHHFPTQPPYSGV